MTICMAAIGADVTGREGSAVVVASDRMVTMANLIEFEHTVPKALGIGGRAVALIAGDSLIGSHLVKEVAASVAAGPITVAQPAQDLSAKYAETRNNHAEAEADILAPRGLTWLDGGAPARQVARAAEPSDWWEFEVALLLGQVHLTEIELSTPGAAPPGVAPGGPNVPHLT